MGVVRERKSNACSCNSNQNQEEIESIVNSTSESEDDTPLIILRTVRRVRVLKIDEPAPKRNTGKRKTQRYFNKKNLETLINDDEYDDNLLEYRKTPFERLMEIEENPLDFLNKFLLELEEEENDEDYRKRKHDDDPYMRISHKIRRSMKLRKNFPSMNNKEIENDLIGFFKEKPYDIFIKLPLNSFERLFMHALAQYHGLDSKNRNENEQMLIQISNNKQIWMPVDCNLCDLLEKRS
ncbi:R3H domain-containing protein 4-like [Onthophagus taurus]|uniref:R3H domain-containing protein 4-like n=1 Tax=Onthophagus taurus TaxID=166361 RepID=UPI0039BDF148